MCGLVMAKRGAAAVEFALVVPLLIMMMFGIIGFGILLAQTLALGNAAREAARYGVVDGRTCAQVIAAAKSASNSISMRGANVTVTVRRGQTAPGSNVCASSTNKPCTGSVAGDSVYVQVAYTSKLIIPLALVDDSVDIKGSGVFRCEFS